MSGDKKFLFAGGNARSGTTALAELLNCHPKVFVMVERYMKELKRGTLRPDFFDRQPVADTKAPKMLERWGDDMGDRWDAATYIGDKVPALSAGFDVLDDRFPGATLIYIVRNPIAVAASYFERKEAGSWKRGVDMAVKQWNKAVRLGLQRCKDGKPLIVVPYEDMFRSRELIDRIFVTLDLDPAEATEERVERVLRTAERIGAREMPRDDEMLRYVSMNASFRQYRELMESYALKPEAIADGSEVA